MAGEFSLAEPCTTMLTGALKKRSAGTSLEVRLPPEGDNRDVDLVTTRFCIDRHATAALISAIQCPVSEPDALSHLVVTV